MVGLVPIMVDRLLVSLVWIASNFFLPLGTTVMISSLFNHWVLERIRRSWMGITFTSTSIDHSLTITQVCALHGYSF